MVWQVLLLPGLYLLSLPDTATFANIVSVLLLGTFVFAWVVAIVLGWAHRQAPQVEALEEAADNAVTRALIASGAAMAGVITIAANLLNFVVPGRPFVAVLAWVLLLNVVPSVGWATRWRDYWVPLVLERWNRFRGGATPS